MVSYVGMQLGIAFSWLGEVLWVKPNRSNFKKTVGLLRGPCGRTEIPGVGRKDVGLEGQVKACLETCPFAGCRQVCLLLPQTLAFMWRGSGLSEVHQIFSFKNCNIELGGICIIWTDSLFLLISTTLTLLFFNE